MTSQEGVVPIGVIHSIQTTEVVNSTQITEVEASVNHIEEVTGEICKEETVHDK